MNILVIGATGGVGRELVRQGLALGHRVAAFVRDQRRLQMSHERLEKVEGDVLVAASVESAVRGRDVVLCALGHKRFWGPSTILSRGTSNVVRAMTDCGVNRFLCITTLGIAESSGRLGAYYSFFTIPFITSFYFRDKERQELIVRASSLDWTIVRPAQLTNTAAVGAVRAGTDIGSFVRTHTVPRSGVAAFMLEEMGRNAYVRTAVGVAR